MLKQKNKYFHYQGLLLPKEKIRCFHHRSYLWKGFSPLQEFQWESFTEGKENPCEFNKGAEGGHVSETMMRPGIN